ncbi:hypothetical protein POX_a01072 [Penicillium oxalicum]|uniref:hypothetical protein n=1 Tax=Penicillium oxalicum TaxID=69781 RepID=UPI0020B8DAAF|nr:hypothetical protein POX_a01072 [Penicillium oxalicum]KAI2794473.1 hypothetical protein POX_a01072 [Penicillium oxalicum]
MSQYLYGLDVSNGGTSAEPTASLMESLVSMLSAVFRFLTCEFGGSTRIWLLQRVAS